MKTLLFFVALAGTLLLVLLVLRLYDEHADRAEWSRLKALQANDPLEYDPQMVADLTEPARRFFNYAIAPGTPLLPVAEIEMAGQFSLGTKENPEYQTMAARQILAAPEGFVWQLNLRGRAPVSGSDSGKWTRFRIFGLIPVARFGDDSDHARSAFARFVAESIFWTPAAVLPGPGVAWESVDANTARVTISRGAFSQTVDLRINAAGQPVEVSFLRWTNANPDKQYRLQPFGGTLSDFREVQGYRLPFKVEAGNMFGTDDYFIFYRAEVKDIRFPHSST